MKKSIFALLILMTGCTPRNCQSIERGFQFSERNYLIRQYSGGKLVGEYKFHGILNSEEKSDGYFFFRADTLVEVSGDLTIKSWN